VTRIGFAPIVRVDTERREIELCATSEALDTYGTVFAYEASRDAFDRWAGNVREMHERRAVGRRVAVRCDDAARKVFVRVRISNGAQDTWEKVLDGTLRGASIGASNVEWRTERHEGREVPVARRYDLVELSLVDLPSNPDALGVTFVRDGAPVAELLDELEGDFPSAQGGEHLVAGDAAPREAHEAAGALAAGQAGAGGQSAEGDAALGLAPAADAIEQRIAREALRAGQAHLATPNAPAAVPASSDRSTRLAALGAPGYVHLPLPQCEEDGAQRAHPPPTLHATDRHTHPSHEHAHSGQPFDAADAHRHNGPHLHLDGTSHTHEHSHDHQHGDHAGPEAERVQAGHSHPHAHPHDHGHAYRLSDGALIEEGLAPVRARGPYSNNPDGPPDTGVPARAEERPTAGAYGQTPEGNREAVFHRAARAILLGCGCPACEAALAALDEDGAPLAPQEERLGVTTPVAALVTRALEAHARRLAASIQAVHASVGHLAGTLGEIERRVAAIEAQPLPGGPQLRVADKTHALLPHGGQSGAAEQMRALEALAGRLTDPQAQIAVATEMIRLQQEAAGLPPAMQAMPRAGLGATS
jgi:hypothetical protein